MIKKFFQHLKERKVTKWLAIYTSTSITIIYLMSTFSTRYNFPPDVFNLTLATLVFGFILVFIFRYNHWSQEKTKFRKSEILLYSLFSVLFILAAIKILTVERLYSLNTADNSIAVLPLNNFSGSKDDEFFSDGVTEDILTQLAKIGQLKVVSRTSVMKYKNTTKNIREIADELGVKNILEGSVRRSGGKVRIVAQLIDAQEDKHLWAETYDRELKDIFQIQNDVAKKIAEQLKVKLTDAEEKRINRLNTENIDAYTFYLKGREYYYSYNPEDNDEAIKLFFKAIQTDSNYALAYAGLADAYAQRYGIYGMDKGWLDSSRAMSLKALQIDTDIAEPYKSLGVANFYSGNLQNALVNYEKAVSINPNLVPALTNIGSIYWVTGNFPEALKWIEKSTSIEVKRSTNYRFLGLIYEGLGENEKAEQNFLKVLQLQPNLSFVISDLTKLYLTTNQLEKCKKFLNDSFNKKPKDFRVLASLGDFELFNENFDKAEEYYKKAIELSSLENGPATEYAFVIRDKNIKKSNEIFDKIIREYETEITNGSGDFNYSYDLSRIYSVKQDRKKALHYFKLTFGLGFRYYKLAEIDPLFKNIKTEPEFKIYIKKMQKEVDKMRKIINSSASD